MRITERALRRIIREEMLREGMFDSFKQGMTGMMIRGEEAAGRALRQAGAAVGMSPMGTVEGTPFVKALYALRDGEGIDSDLAKKLSTATRLLRSGAFYHRELIKAKRAEDENKIRNLDNVVVDIQLKLFGDGSSRRARGILSMITVPDPKLPADRVGAADLFEDLFAGTSETSASNMEALADVFDNVSGYMSSPEAHSES